MIPPRGAWLGAETIASAGVKLWQGLFGYYGLQHNRRNTVKIECSPQGVAALTVVDMYTLWVERESSRPEHWLGRAAKGYSLCQGAWKLIFLHNLLEYSSSSGTFEAS